MTAPRPRASPLRRRMIEDMTVRNLSPATQRSYLHAVAKFSRYFSRSPDRLDIEDVRAFQVFLVSQKISWPALNQTVCALRFFYGVTLNRPEIPERIAYAREPRKLPVILSADEVVRFLEAVPSLKTRTALTTAYAAGLRASEAVSLKVACSRAVFTLVSLTGLFAFIRGAFTLRAAADGKPGASGPKAFAHMAGGIAAWHIVAVIEAVQTSLGIAVLNIR